MSGPLLEVERLTVEFGSTESPLVAASDVSFTVDAGDVVVQLRELLQVQPGAAGHVQQ